MTKPILIRPTKKPDPNFERTDVAMSDSLAGFSILTDSKYRGGSGSGRSTP